MNYINVILELFSYLIGFCILDEKISQFFIDNYFIVLGFRLNLSEPDLEKCITNIYQTLTVLMIKPFSQGETLLLNIVLF